MKKTIFTSFVVIIIASIVFTLGYIFIPQVTSSNGIVYQLHSGSGKRRFLQELTSQRVINHPYLFSLYTLFHLRSQLKAGEYVFPQGATSYSIWKQVTEGKGLSYHAFTIVPGWTFKQLKDELLQTPNLRHVISTMSDQEIMAELGAKQASPEGQFFPETYYYTIDNPDIVILKRAYDLMQERLEAAWQNRQAGLPYKTSYDALIAASLIEREAYLNAERPIIAGVLVNRLHANMLLQFDPTVIYGMGDKYQGKIRKEDLTTNTPYNTYVNKGLPPTPIAMPSYDSIKAALHPQVSNYLYFVAKGDGSHQFSETLLEHHEAVSDAIIRQAGYFNEVKVSQLVNTYLFHQHDNTKPLLGKNYGQRQIYFH